MNQPIFFIATKVAIFLVLSIGLKAQTTYNQLAADTIIVANNSWGINTYLLGGKKLNLPVMMWFMVDDPEAYDAIRAAHLSSQFSTLGYSISGVFLFSGALINDDNRLLSRRLIRTGVVAAVGGLAFHVLTEIFKRKAVIKYNESIRFYYEYSTLGLQQFNNEFGFRIQF